MSACVLLNLLNELEKIDKMRGLPSILLHFHIEFHKFNNTGARMLESIYHMTLKLLDFAIYMQRYYGHNYIAQPKSVNH